MASTMDSIIQKAAKKYQYLAHLDTGGHKPHFFFHSDFDVSANKRYKSRQSGESRINFCKRHGIRHAVPNKGKIYDYTEGKHYNTLRDWADANHQRVEDISYGSYDPTNPLAGMYGPAHVSLNDLLVSWDPTWASPEDVQKADIKETEDRDKAIKDIRNVLSVAQTLINEALAKLEKLN